MSSVSNSNGLYR